MHRLYLFEEHFDFYSLGQLWMKSLKTFTYKYLCEYKFPFVLGKYLQLELPDYMVNVGLTLWETAKLFSIMVSFAFAQALYVNFSCFTFSTAFFLNGHSSKCKAVSHNGSNLHFRNDTQC